MTRILTQEEIDLLQIAASGEAHRIRKHAGTNDQLRKAKILEELSDHLRTSQYVELP